MFENERVRVWDLALAPGASLATHIHRVDYFFIVASGGLALPPATAALAQLAKAARQADAPAPDTLLLAVYLVAARALLLEADAPPALTDALARLHQLRATPRSPTP